MYRRSRETPPLSRSSTAKVTRKRARDRSRSRPSGCGGLSCMVSEGEAFCPGHATAFFEVHEDPDPRAKGSRGAGLSLSLGVRTVAKVREARRSSLDIMVKERRQKAEVTQRVVEQLTGSRSPDIQILNETPLPVSQGL